MDERFKQRLVGAAVLVLLGVIFIPMILDRPPEPEVIVEHPKLPSRAELDFSSRIVPLSEPRTSLVETDRRRVVVEESLIPEKPEEPTADEPEKITAIVETPSQDKQPAAAPAEPPKAQAPPTGWAIQLGSFSSAENAMALRDQLKDKGYVAFIETARVGGKDITRVFVGPELAKERAGELVKKLQAETKLKGMVVQYPGS